VISEYLQQWTTIQTIRMAGFSINDVWITYRGIGGDRDEIDVAGYLTGIVVLPVLDRDLTAHAVNRMIADRDVPIDGAHYSTDLVTAASGYADTLRRLVVSPDGYRFDRPARTEPHGIMPDGSTAATAQDSADDAESRRCNALFETGLLEGAGSTGPRPVRQRCRSVQLVQVRIALLLCILEYG
jgi:hypothetical protein